MRAATSWSHEQDHAHQEIRYRMSIEDDTSFLTTVPTMAVLGRDALRILAIGAESRTIHEGEVLFTAGEAADAGYLVQEGSFVLKSAKDPSQDITVGRGALLGELALITSTTRPLTAIAAETSSVLRISRSLFLKILEGFPGAAIKLRDHIAKRANHTAMEIEAIRDSLEPGLRR
jgi:CRP-like cAMP-binding protein